MRGLSLNWWSSLTNVEKEEFLFIFSSFITGGKCRRYETLTGSEIEKIYINFHEV